MAVALRSVGTRAAGATPGVPSGVQNDDVVVIWVTGNTFSADRFPDVTGFALVGIQYSGAPATTGRYLAALVRKQQAGDPTSGTYSITVTGGNVGTAQAYAFTGVDLTGSLAVKIGGNSETASNSTTPAVSGTAVVGDYIHYTGASSGSTWLVNSVTSGWVEDSTASPAAVMHTFSQTAAGTSIGPVQATMNFASTNRTAMMIRLPEAGLVPNEGSAEGASTWAGSASGSSSSGEGAATGTWTTTGTASGTKAPRGTVTASHEWSGYAISGAGLPDYVTLAQVRAALADRDSGRVNIGLFGASVCEGYPAPIDLWVETQLAQKLRDKYATTGLGSGGGYGYIGIPTFGLENTATTPVGYAGGAFNETLGWGGHHRVWFATALQTSPGLTLTLPDDASSVVIETVTGAGGSAVGGRYRVNGGSWVVFSTLSASVDKLDVTVPGPLSTGDVIEIAHNTSGVGNVVVSGFRVYNGDETKGIQVHNHGHYGYRIQDWNVARNVADPANWINTLNDYDLLIFSDWGGNDGSGPGNLSAAQFYTAFSELITWMRSTGGYAGDILIASLYNIEFARTFVDPWADYVEAMRVIALEQNVAFIQLDQFMPPTPNAIYAPDNIHGNADGSAYEIMADLFMSRIAAQEGLAEGYWDVTGSATGQTPRRGSATDSWSATGSGAGVADREGAATGTWEVSGAATGQRTPEGSATGSWATTGTASGKRSPRGTASGAFTATGTATGTNPAKGSASGAWVVSGGGTGLRVPKGSTTGAWATTGTASGRKVQNGSAVGTWVASGTATGEKEQQGSAAGAWVSTGTASGQRVPKGASAIGDHQWTGLGYGDNGEGNPAEGFWTVTGSGSGETMPLGSATGGHDWSGSGSGLTARSGSATGTHQWSGIGGGVTTRFGAATGSHQWDGSAQGGQVASGSATGTWETTGIAGGARTSRGEAPGSFNISGSASGGQQSKGSAVGLWTVTGSALGAALHHGSAVGGHTWSGSGSGGTITTGSATGTHQWSGIATGFSAPPGPTESPRAVIVTRRWKATIISSAEEV